MPLSCLTSIGALAPGARFVLHIPYIPCRDWAVLRRVPLKVRLQKALRKLLKPPIRMQDAPGRGTAIIFQDSMRNGQMLCLENILDVEPVRTLLTHNEPDCVCIALRWQSRTGMGVPQIAGLQFCRTQLNQGCSRCATCSVPRRSKWQTRRVRQGDILGTFCRGKERTGHLGSFVAFYSDWILASSTGFPLSCSSRSHRVRQVGFC